METRTLAALAVFLLILSLPGIVAAIGLLTFGPWSRILAIVPSPWRAPVPA